jgi:hypothetical protein
MPTVLRIGPYRFFFYSGDGDEPPHIHVERDDKIAKYWLDPVKLQYSGGFTKADINKIHQIINEYKQKLLETWYDYFSQDGNPKS